MKRLRSVSLLLALAGSLPAVAQQPQQAQQPQRRTVSLKEALQLAAKQGPDVAAARAQAEIARAGVQRAWTAWQPDVSATGTFDHTNGNAVFDLGSLASIFALRPGATIPAPIEIVKQNNWYGTGQISQPLFTPQGLFGPGIANSSAEA